MSTTLIHYPPITYGQGSFSSIRLDRCLYVDKTRFIRTLEQERFVFFIRPRRFGKTLWLAMLDAYYDRVVADEFDAVFAGTDIGREPTGNRSRYVVLYFDFSAFKQALPTPGGELRGTLHPPRPRRPVAQPRPVRRGRGARHPRAPVDQRQAPGAVPVRERP